MRSKYLLFLLALGYLPIQALAQATEIKWATEIEGTIEGESDSAKLLWIERDGKQLQAYGDRPNDKHMNEKYRRTYGVPLLAKFPYELTGIFTTPGGKILLKDKDGELWAVSNYLHNSVQKKGAEVTEQKIAYLGGPFNKIWTDGESILAQRKVGNILEFKEVNGEEKKLSMRAKRVSDSQNFLFYDLASQWKDTGRQKPNKQSLSNKGSGTSSP